MKLLRFIQYKFKTPILLDVAIAMREDNGNDAGMITFQMLESIFLELSEDWRKAISGKAKAVNHYPAIRDNQLVWVGLMLSDIHALTATPTEIRQVNHE